MADSNTSSENFNKLKNMDHSITNFFTNNIIVLLIGDLRTYKQ